MILSKESQKIILEIKNQIYLWKYLIKRNIERNMYFFAGIFTEEEAKEVKKRKRKERWKKIKKRKSVEG